jgi:hypothetical protein
VPPSPNCNLGTRNVSQLSIATRGEMRWDGPLLFLELKLEGGKICAGEEAGCVGQVGGTFSGSSAGGALLLAVGEGSSD